MKVVIITGNQANQKALCHKIARAANVSAIVVSANVPRKRPDLGKRLASLAARVETRLAGRPFVAAWLDLLKEYEKEFPAFPDAELVRVGNVNDAATRETLARHRPDLTIVSGTNLVGRKTIAAAGSIVNLHTGISPYVKGGPNCTNWCLAKNWFHLIGSTVMWLDAGIDTGKIIATEQTPLDGSENLLALHRKVMDHAHDLYVRAIAKIAEGANVPAVPQDEIAAGALFYTKDWTWREMRRALKNFERNYAPHFADRQKAEELKAGLRLVAMEDCGQWSAAGGQKKTVDGR